MAWTCWTGWMLPRVLPRASSPDPTGAPANIARVPTISRFFGLTVAIISTTTRHPHFHVRHAEGAAKIRIDVVEVIDSSLPTRQLRIALAWAELHQFELLENWRRARAGETLKEIDPLR